MLTDSINDMTSFILVMRRFCREHTTLLKILWW